MNKAVLIEDALRLSDFLVKSDPGDHVMGDETREGASLRLLRYVVARLRLEQDVIILQQTYVGLGPDGDLDDCAFRGLSPVERMLCNATAHEGFDRFMSGVPSRLSRAYKALFDHYNS